MRTQEKETLIKSPMKPWQTQHSYHFLADQSKSSETSFELDISDWTSTQLTTTPNCSCGEEDQNIFRPQMPLFIQNYIKEWLAFRELHTSLWQQGCMWSWNEKKVIKLMITTLSSRKGIAVLHAKKTILVADKS